MFFICLCKRCDPGRSHFWPQSHNLNKLGKGALDDAIYQIFKHTSPIEPTVTNCDISDNNSQIKCVIADVTGK